MCEVFTEQEYEARCKAVREMTTCEYCKLCMHEQEHGIYLSASEIKMLLNK